MVNDKEIERVVGEIKLCCRIYLDNVQAFNPDASTDRIIEKIIADSDRLKVLYDTNKPQVEQ